MKGKDGEVIKLGIMRKEFDKPQVFAIRRGTVHLKSVKATDLDDGYLYVRITSFIESTFDDFFKIIQAHKNKYGKIKGLIVDLRNNPGGLFEQAVKLSDLFLDDGVIVTTMGRNEKQKEVTKAKKEGTMEYFPIIVVVNEFTASASEIFSGALQDNNRALILGQRTFGKGSVQSVIDLGDGSGLKLTIARYYTPLGREIQAEGIRPDILVDDVDTDAYEKAIKKKNVRRESDMKGHLENLKDKQKAVNTAETGMPSSKKELLKDFQVAQAFNYLKASKVFHKEDGSTIKPLKQ
jgi:carboxyl-terminal processing protease